MFGKNLAPHRGKVVVVADVGSGSAAVAIVALEPGAPATVLAAERAVLPIEERSREATITAICGRLVATGESVMKLYAAEKGKTLRVSGLYCTIHAPWTRSITLDARSRSEEDVVVTEGLIGALAKQALTEQKELDASNILEAAVIRVELNGYATGSPVGVRAHEEHVSVLASDCDPNLRAGIETGFQRLFPQLRPTFRSFTRAVLSAMQEWHDVERDYFIVDIASEGAELTAVRDGAITGQHFVSEGTRNILKRLAPGAMPEEALGLVRMVEHDQCSTAACQTMRDSMARVEPELVRVFGEGMSASASLRRLPDTLVLIAQEDFATWLERFFSRIDFTQFTSTMRPFSVRVLTPADLASSVAARRGTTLDIGTTLSVALAAREDR
jgi:hypothetical protein